MVFLRRKAGGRWQHRKRLRVGAIEERRWRREIMISNGLANLFTRHDYAFIHISSTTTVCYMHTNLHDAHNTPNKSQHKHYTSCIGTKHNTMQSHKHSGHSETIIQQSMTEHDITQHLKSQQTTTQHYASWLESIFTHISAALAQKSLYCLSLKQRTRG